MKSGNNNREQLRLIRRFLYGLMNEIEENSFFEKVKIDENLRRLAVSEAVLCKNYNLEQRREKYLSPPKLVGKDKKGSDK